MSNKHPPEISGYEFVRHGTSRSGWSRSPDLLYICERCGSSMRADHDDYFNCSCRAMHLDRDAVRFGSRFGTDAILTYRRLPDARVLIWFLLKAAALLFRDVENKEWFLYACQI